MKNILVCCKEILAIGNGQVLMVYTIPCVTCSDV